MSRIIPNRFLAERLAADYVAASSALRWVRAGTKVSDPATLVGIPVLDPQILARLPLLRAAPPEAVAVLARHAVERSFAPDEVIFLAGTEPGGLLVVLSGRVRVVRGRGDRQHVVHWEDVGGTLGDVPLFAGGVYPATALAAEPTRCAVIPREGIRAAIAARPEIAFLLLERLATRVRGLVARLDRVALQGTTARLASYLLELPTDPSGRIVQLGLTQGELAEELGTVREIVVRGLRALRRQGTIDSLGRGRFEIVSREELRQTAER
jgi:CRP/FNR family transcriptional regulator